MQKTKQKKWTLPQQWMWLCNRTNQWTY